MSKLYVETTSYGDAQYYDASVYVGRVLPLRYWGSEHFQLSDHDGMVLDTYPTFAAADRAMHVYADTLAGTWV